MLLKVREAFSVQQSQGLDTLMAGLDPQALDLLKVCHLHVYYLPLSLSSSTELVTFCI